MARRRPWDINTDQDLPEPIRLIGVKTFRAAVEASHAARNSVPDLAPREIFGQWSQAMAIASLRMSLKARRIGGEPVRLHGVEVAPLENGSALVIVQSVCRGPQGTPIPAYKRGAGIERVLNRIPQLYLKGILDPPIQPEHSVHVLGIEHVRELDGSDISRWWILDWAVLGEDVIIRGRSLEGEPITTATTNNDPSPEPEPDFEVKRRRR